MNEALWTIFWGVITFSLLIVIHEGGHFLSARVFGVKVHEFMLGLPGPAIRIQGKKTTYGVTAIPLGGYVKIAGMEPGPEDPLLGDALAALTRERSLDGERLAVADGYRRRARRRAALHPRGLGRRHPRGPQERHLPGRLPGRGRR